MLHVSGLPERAAVSFEAIGDSPNGDGVLRFALRTAPRTAVLTDCALPAGEVFGFLGPNRAGKTTAIRPPVAWEEKVLTVTWVCRSLVR